MLVAVIDEVESSWTGEMILYHFFSEITAKHFKRHSMVPAIGTFLDHQSF